MGQSARKETPDETHRRATTVAGGFDDAVERISTVYDTSGRVSTITQYDDPTVGSGNVVDQVKYTWDGWSNLTQFAMDRNSAISGGTDASDGYYDVDYTWEKAVAGRNTIRKTTMVLPEGSTLTYEYLSTSSLHDADASRVTRVKVSTTAVATYAYNGLGQLVGTSLPQPDVFMTLYDPADLDDYDRIDNFGRVTQSKWTRDLGTDKDFYHTSITWDRNSRGEALGTGHLATGRGIRFDARGRAHGEEGRIGSRDRSTALLSPVASLGASPRGGSSITSRTREQNWTLDQVGNWEIAKLDLDGDNNWNETGEYNDDRTHNVVNELTARDTDDNGTDNYTLTYDGVGNLTDDGEAYEYVYDVWGRLRKVLNTSTQALIEEFWYNGLGFRITFHADATGNGTTDGSDPKYHLIYDERWRHVATYRADDDNPKEAFVPHQAGLDGGGSSSYIDSVILRQRDANSGWVNAADGTMEERRFYCQNWRNDVSVVLTSAAVMVEWVKFSAYGVPFGLPAADLDSSGDTTAGEVNTIETWAAAYDVRADLDLDGDIDGDDATLANGYVGRNLGWAVLSDETVANRIGCAGCHKDINLDIQHVRNRVLEPHLGRWTRRDPLGYVDGMSLFEYVHSAPSGSTDPQGLGYDDCATCLNEQLTHPEVLHLYREAREACKNTAFPLPENPADFIKCCKNAEDPKGCGGQAHPNAYSDFKCDRNTNSGSVVKICLCPDNWKPQTTPNSCAEMIKEEIINAWQACHFGNLEITCNELETTFGPFVQICWDLGAFCWMYPDKCHPEDPAATCHNYCKDYEGVPENDPRFNACLANCKKVATWKNGYCLSDKNRPRPIR